MKLYGSYTSPYVRHCRIVLESMGQDYQFIETDYAASAKASPTQRVPFLHDGEVKLTDSSSILLYLKQRRGDTGFTDPDDFELYSLANTTLDAEINLFLLSKDGVGPDNSGYLARQRSRVQTALDQLNTLISKQSVREHNYSDGQVRLACLLDWALFRERFDLQGHSELAHFLNTIRGWSVFADTAPPA